jgi:tetratricopeptide (TPR) repeat protein/ppGpp synthetase/RelA/SpoT-type nucleotidyltranferase
MEALHIYAPMGHALGLTAVASDMEEISLRLLFPTSFAEVAQWVALRTDTNKGVLHRCGERLQCAVSNHPEFKTLASSISIQTRTKSARSTMKKLLRSGASGGGRQRDQVYDLIGLRAIVHPLLPLTEDLDSDTNETSMQEKAVQACYLVERIAHSLWETVPGRSKDYIASPKANGYRSLHSTVRVEGETDVTIARGANIGQMNEKEMYGNGDISRPPATMELQIRTQAMHEQAEMGDSAHAAYKGGLDVAQSRRLRRLTRLMGVSSGQGEDRGSVAKTAHALFRDLDLDGDGHVSAEEMERAIEELGGDSVANFGTRAIMAAADENGDGVVSPEELMSLQKRVASTLLTNARKTKFSSLHVPTIETKPDLEAGRRVQRVQNAMQGFMRMFSRAGVPRPDAEWRITEMSSDKSNGKVYASVLPVHGPWVIGAVMDRDCDMVVDLPTVSGRHARLEVIRKAGSSVCMLTDLGSTNGTWVNAARITPFQEVPLYPNDVIRLAEPGIEFRVTVARAADGEGGEGREENELIQRSWIDLALGMIQRLYKEQHGVVIEGVQRAEDVERVARELLGLGSYGQAYASLASGVVAMPQEPTLWALLASVERHRARHKQENSSGGTVRAFFRAAVEAFELMKADDVKSRGLARVFSSWAKFEFDYRNEGAGRKLFRKGVDWARIADSYADNEYLVAKLLHSWARRERKGGDAFAAAQLCHEALDACPTNAHVLTLLGTIEADAGKVESARKRFESVASLTPDHLGMSVHTNKNNNKSDSNGTSKSPDPRVPALQAWARMEATLGNATLARELFTKAVHLDPNNTFVLQAFAVAESKTGGDPEVARGMFEQCIEIDPGCRAAYHAWARMEEGLGNLDEARRLYAAVLRLDPRSTAALGSLGRLEWRHGNLEEGRRLLQMALEVDPRHVGSLQELASLLRSENETSQAYRLEKKVRRLVQDRRAALAAIAR